MTSFYELLTGGGGGGGGRGSIGTVPPLCIQTSDLRSEGTMRTTEIMHS